MPEETPAPLPVKKRPFFFMVLSIFSLVYFFVYAVLFIAGFFFSGWVTEAINLYSPQEQYPKQQVQLLLAVFSVLFILALSGVIVMLKLRRAGYYIFGIAALLLASFQLIRPQTSISGTIVYIVLLILFGLYFKRFR